MNKTIVIGDRQRGKTTELIKLSAEKQIPILALNRNLQRQIIIRALELELQIPEPVLIKDIIPSTDGTRRVSSIGRLIVDDSLDLLQMLLGINIEAAAINTGNEVLEPITVVDLNKNNDSTK